ncbi:hypothetical protein BFG07_00080 [Kosakonia cowanii]|uniref:hypothetical protein n=1 Tax=Kosakonia cowanii TaxID=208223 RepID=UPI000B962205|nr:hypothetical protein [Kosakonia cowanii]AST67242.1 hypothetical protein BFG07_00080 [Kosakonia cowanii]
MKNRVETFALAAVISGGIFIAYPGAISSSYSIFIIIATYVLFIILCSYIGNVVYNYNLNNNSKKSTIKNIIFLFTGIAIIFLFGFLLNRIIF